MAEERSEKLVTLYDQLIGLFEIAWGQHGHRAVHFGYYDEAHDDASSAIVNTTRQLANAVDVDASDRVLDFGCGAGGDAVWLASERGATVVGVDLVVDQLERGQEAAEEAGVEDRVTFWRDDFHELVSVEDDSMDVVWALESLSHSTERAEAMARAHDALDAWGRLAVADVFLKDADVSEAERAVLDSIESDMGLRYAPVEEFRETLVDAGFRDVEFHDVTPAVVAGSDQSVISSRLLGPLSKAGSALGLGPDAQAQYFEFLSNAYDLLEAGTAGYFFVTARAGAETPE